MAQLDEYTEGHTAAIEYNLEHDGASFDASGMTPSLVLKDSDGTEVDVTGDCEWADDSISKIRYNPDAADLVEGTYTLHWKVTDANGKVAFYPQGGPITIKVYST